MGDVRDIRIADTNRACRNKPSDMARSQTAGRHTDTGDHTHSSPTMLDYRTQPVRLPPSRPYSLHGHLPCSRYKGAQEPQLEPII
jgi:hypothetical protein